MREKMKRTMELMEARRAQRYHWVQDGDGKIVFRGNERQAQSHYRKAGGYKAGFSLMSKTMDGDRPETAAEPSGGEAEAPAEGRIMKNRLMDIVEQFETSIVRAQMDEASGRKTLNLKSMWDKAMTSKEVIRRQEQDPKLAKMFGSEE